MKLLANENVPAVSVDHMKETGYDIKSVGKDFAGITDKEVIKIAQSEKRTIITFDKDYGELVFKKGLKPEAGVIFLRLEKFDPIEPAKLLEEIFINQKLVFQNTFTVIDETGIRQRRYKIE